MKRITIFLLALTIGFALQAQTPSNCDFSAVAPSGQIFYYKLQNNDTEVKLVPPRDNIGDILSNYHPSGNVIIPDSVEWMGVVLPVVSIGSWALASNSITSISLSGTLKKIEQYAFRGTSITEIEIPSNITRIECYSFENCVSLRKVRVMCTNALSGIAGSTSNLSSPSNNIFRYCTNIEEVYLEQYIAIPKDNITNITFGNSINTIPTTFNNCDRLKKVVIGNSIHTIPSECFEECDSLKIVVLGDSVSHISSFAFRKCISLDTIFAKPDTAPTLGTNVFNFTPSSKVVVTYCNVDYATAWGTTGFNYHTADVYNINLNVNNSSYGSATITQAVNCENTATIAAMPNLYYRFANWSDGDSTNPRVITLSQDTTLTAMFERVSYVVSTYSNNITMGNSEGNGIYNVGDSVTLTAVAICGYRFNHWSNGSMENPLTFSPISDTNIVAFFEIALDTIFVPDTTLETIVIYDTTIIPVTIYDTNVVTIPIFDTVELTIPFFDTLVIQIIDTLLAPIHDTIFLFDTIFLYDTIYIHDTIVTGLSDDSIINAKIYTSHGYIIIEGANVDKIMLFDINGRLLGVQRNEGNGIVRFDVPTSGTYIVKFGNNITRKVVVIK